MPQKKKQTRAKKTFPPADVLKASGLQSLPLHRGQPSLYDPSFCDRIVEYMKLGNSVTSFAAELGVSRDTIYAWANMHKEFSDAVKRGQHELERWIENMFRLMATGQLKRVKREVVRKKDDGTEEVIHREFEPAQGNAAAAIFLAKNVVNWTDKKDITISPGPKRNFQDMTVQQIEDMIIETQNLLKPANG